MSKKNIIDTQQVIIFKFICKNSKPMYYGQLARKEEEYPKIRMSINSLVKKEILKKIPKSESGITDTRGRSRDCFILNEDMDDEYIALIVKHNMITKRHNDRVKLMNSGAFQGMIIRYIKIYVQRLGLELTDDEFDNIFGLSLIFPGVLEDMARGNLPLTFHLIHKYNYGLLLYERPLEFIKQQFINELLLRSIAEISKGDDIFSIDQMGKIGVIEYNISVKIHTSKMNTIKLSSRYYKYRNGRVKLDNEHVFDRVDYNVGNL